MIGVVDEVCCGLVWWYKGLSCVRAINVAFFDRALVTIFVYEWYAQLKHSVLTDELIAHCYINLHIQGDSI